MSVTSNPKLEKALPAIFNGLLQFFSGLFRDIYFKDVTTGTKTTKAEKKITVKNKQCYLKNQRKSFYNDSVIKDSKGWTLKDLVFELSQENNLILAPDSLLLWRHANVSPMNFLHSCLVIQHRWFLPWFQMSYLTDAHWLNTNWTVSVCLILQLWRATFIHKIQKIPINETFLVIFIHCVKCWKTKSYRSDNNVCTTKLLFLLDLRLQQSRYIITDHETIYCRFPALALLPMVAAAYVPSAESWTSRCEIQIDLE